MENSPNSSQFNLTPLIQASEQHHFRIKKWEVIFGIAAIFAIGSFLILYEFYGTKFLQREYEEIYALVPDKVSQSAAIIIHLPEGVKINIAEAKDKISFNPALEGEWSSGKNAEYLIFQQKQKLEVGKYYSVTLATEAVKIQKDFLADEDPKIVSIFPNNNSESSEYS